MSGVEPTADVRSAKREGSPDPLRNSGIRSLEVAPVRETVWRLG